MDRDMYQAGPSANPPEDDGTKEQREEAHQQQLSPNTLKLAAAECLKSWIYYLDMLNNMCDAGFRLSQSLTNLSQMQNVHLSTQCQLSWEELKKATIIASNSVKSHIGAAMQDMSIGDTFTEADAQRQMEHNQQIITENILTFVNLQYQFSIAGCESFGSMAMCPSCQTTPGGVHNPDCPMVALQHCFSKLDTRSQMSSPHFSTERALESPKGQDKEAPRLHSPSGDARGPSPHQDGGPRGPSPVQGFAEAFRGPLETLRGPFPTPGQLHTMKMPFPGRSSRSPLHFPLFPLNCQRRWSEAAAVEVTGGDSGEESTMRRWSMPWDTAVAGGEGSSQHRYLPSKLIVPSTSTSQERSRSTTPESVPPAPPQPMNMGPSILPTGEGLAEAIQLLSCRPARSSIPTTSIPGHSYIPHWAETHEERMHRRIMYPGPASQRGNWQSVDVPHASAGMPPSEHYEYFPPAQSLTSRKSSSSTDSSSCMSIHSRSTTSSSERGSASEGSGPDAIRLHTSFYSMWSGSEHLPFIRLPESQEPQEDSDTDDPPTEKSGTKQYPPPT